jgi:hypothetical protein
VDFDESLGVEVLSVKLTHSGLESEDSLIGRYSQVDDSVVKSDILLDTSELLLLSFFFVFFLLFLKLDISGIAFVTLVHYDSTSVSNLERQDGHGGSNDEALLNVEFDLNGAIIDGTWGLDDLGHNFDNGFGIDRSRKIFHLFAGGLFENNALDSSIDFTHHDEARFALSADVLSTTSNSNSLSFHLNVQVSDVVILLAETILRVTLRSVHGEDAVIGGVWVSTDILNFLCLALSFLHSFSFAFFVGFGFFLLLFLFFTVSLELGHILFRLSRTLVSIGISGCFLSLLSLFLLLWWWANIAADGLQSFEFRNCYVDFSLGGLVFLH